MMAVAGLKTFVAIGSSESFRVVAPIHSAFESASTEISVTFFVCAALVTWNFGRMCALGSLLLAACAATVLCWPAPAPTFHMDDNMVYYRTPEVVGACFAAAVLLLVVAAGLRTLVASADPTWCLRRRVLALLSMVLLVVPFLYSALSGVVGLWWTRFVPQGVLVSIYAGLLGAAWVVVSARRAEISAESLMLWDAEGNYRP